MNRNEKVACGLRMQRAKRRISQRQLAEAIDVNPSTISSWETRGGVSIDDMWKLADFYECSLDELAGRKVS